MREGWELTAWKDVLEIRSGRNQKEVINSDGKYPILGSAGIVGFKFISILFEIILSPFTFINNNQMFLNLSKNQVLN